ncbi:MAG TPA: hypothetical protein VGR81_10810 [Candidatus Acidoferrales bacterium]|nr:hypothetical protein [Candidatus Acidoferrales bacterium]
MHDPIQHFIGFLFLFSHLAAPSYLFFIQRLKTQSPGRFSVRAWRLLLGSGFGKPPEENFLPSPCIFHASQSDRGAWGIVMQKVKIQTGPITPDFPFRWKRKPVRELSSPHRIFAGFQNLTIRTG